MTSVGKASSRYSRGFTLIEIMIVIVIIGILGAFIVPKIIQNQQIQPLQRV